MRYVWGRSQKIRGAREVLIFKRVMDPDVVILNQTCHRRLIQVVSMILIRQAEADDTCSINIAAPECLLVVRVIVFVLSHPSASAPGGHGIFFLRNAARMRAQVEDVEHAWCISPCRETRSVLGIND
jgi:hypothetical protein